MEDGCGERLMTSGGGDEVEDDSVVDETYFEECRVMFSHRLKDHSCMWNMDDDNLCGQGEANANNEERGADCFSE